MPEKATQRSGKSASTQAGRFVFKEMHRLHEGEGAAKSEKQAIAIGLSKARNAGVKVKGGSSAKPTRKSSKRKASGAKPSPGKRSTSSKRTGSATRKASPAASKRTKAQRSTSARKGARTRASR